MKGKNSLNNYEHLEDWKVVILGYTKLEPPKKIEKYKIILKNRQKLKQGLILIKYQNSKKRGESHFSKKKEVIPKLDLGTRNKFKVLSESIANANNVGLLHSPDEGCIATSEILGQTWP